MLTCLLTCMLTWLCWLTCDSHGDCSVPLYHLSHSSHDLALVTSISWLWILASWLPYLDFGFCTCIAHILTLDFTFVISMHWSWTWSWWILYPHHGWWHFAIFTIYADIALCNSHWWIVTLWSHFTHLVVDTCSWDVSRLIIFTIALLHLDGVSLPSFLRMILHATLIIDLTLWLSCWSECALNALHSTHVTCVLYPHDAVTIHSLHISDCNWHLMS